jgi:hypothetical protein
MADERRQTTRGVRIAPRRVGERTGRRRTLDERLRVRFPALFHRLGAIALRRVAVSEPVFQLFTFRRGLVVRQEDFLDRSEALAAAGAREQGC